MAQEKLIDVRSLSTFEFPQHEKCFAREIVGPKTDYDRCSIAYTVLLADGGAEPHIHDEADHLYYVIKGGFIYKNFMDPDIHVTEGQALFAPHGIRHQVTGDGIDDCEYIICTTPPAWAK